MQQHHPHTRLYRWKQDEITCSSRDTLSTCPQVGADGQVDGLSPAEKSSFTINH